MRSSARDRTKAPHIVHAADDACSAAVGGRAFRLNVTRVVRAGSPERRRALGVCVELHLEPQVQGNILANSRADLRQRGRPHRVVLASTSRAFSSATGARRLILLLCDPTVTSSELTRTRSERSAAEYPVRKGEHPERRQFGVAPHDRGTYHFQMMKDPSTSALAPTAPRVLPHRDRTPPPCSSRAIW